MASEKGSPSVVRQVLYGGSLLLMLAGLLSIPFVSTELAIGIAALSAILLFIAKALTRQR